MKYRPEVDGLRTVAVVPVILFHAGATLFGGGFVGVDIFFVISGYLITTILINELEEGRFSILRFYERRARRILPALFFVILCCIPFAFAWMVPSQLEDFGKSIFFVALFASNFFFWQQSGYFQPASEENVLLHTWSLAVEEQYYVFFPIILMLCWRFGRRTVFWIIIVAALASLILGDWGGRMRSDAAFYLIPYRAWELFAGSICAFLLTGRGARRNEGLAALGLALILWSIFWFDGSMPFPSFWALAPVGGTALVILYARADTWVGWLLSRPLMVGIGLISYSAYLWHQPLFAFARIKAIFEPDPWVMGLLVLASFALAYLSWRFVEQPFRRRPTPALQKQSALFAVSAAVLIAAMAFGWVLGSKNGFPGRDLALTQAPLIDPQHARALTWQALRDKSAEAARRNAFLEGPASTKVLLVGDSHSKDMFNAFWQNQELYPDTAFIRVDMVVQCRDRSLENAFTPCASTFLKEHQDLAAAATHIILTPRWASRGPKGLGLAEAYLDALSGGDAQVILTSSTVEYHPEAPRLIRRVARDTGYGAGKDFDKPGADALFYQYQLPEIAAYNAQLKDIAARYPDVIFASKAEIICDETSKRCDGVTPDGDAVYFDYGHWTMPGAAHFGRKMHATDWPVRF